MTQLIHCISGPRNISSALMYSFAQRHDTSVVDEPFYAAYLNRYPQIEHPGRDAILASQNTDPYAVVKELKNQSEKYLFIKGMAHHLKDLDVTHFFTDKTFYLIRHPAKLIASFQKVIQKPTLQDIGLAEEAKLFKISRSHAKPVVVLTEKLAKNPEKELPKLCAALGLDFQPAMLHWPAGPKPYDGVWAKYWYHNLHKSTHFKPFSTTEPQLDKHGLQLLDKALPYYEFLADYAL